jgi:CDP-4-dehydro-6-deoxyglucose reductase, E3
LEFFLPKIYLSNGVEFDCSGDQTILDSAIQNNVVIEHSCKNGRCGVCLAPVLQGDTKTIRDESFVDVDGVNGSTILTCCSVAVSDVYLDIEDIGALASLPIQTLPCRIDAIEYLNNEVLGLLLRLPPNAIFKFLPGQYIDLIHAGNRRSYSIAGAPRSDGKLEFQIKKVENGVMSDYLFSQAADNDLLRLEGPLGTFSYRDDASENIVLLATGTGIAPIRAILEEFKAIGLEKNIYVVWGGRVKSDFYFDTNTIGIKHSFMPVLSRERLDGAFFGYVQDAVVNLGIDLRKTTVYACGSGMMIRDAKALLVGHGLAPNRFYSDAFVSSN